MITYTSIKNDGYVRISRLVMHGLCPKHLFTSIDCDVSLINGYAGPAGLTEWFVPASEARESITIGWDWHVCLLTSRVLFTQDDVRSNLMLIDLTGKDLGPVQTSRAIKSWIAKSPWIKEVGRALVSAGLPYSESLNELN